jgi:outer membrane immunogenic protein
MTKLAFATGTALATILVASSTFAADLGVPRGPYIPPPPPQYSWTGCYAGANFGLAAGHNQWTDTQPDGNIDGNTTSARTAHSDMSGGVAGGQLGCDLQFNGNWVVGLAGSLDWSDMSGNTQDQFNAPWNLHNNVDWYGTVTGRVGAAFNNVLLYGKGGLAFAHNNFEIENSGVTLGTPSDTRLGWTAGAGLEWAFAPNWSAFLEADYFGFPSKTETFNFVPGFINTPTTINVKPYFDSFTFGVNYRFGGGAPYASRY